MHKLLYKTEVTCQSLCLWASVQAYLDKMWPLCQRAVWGEFEEKQTSWMSLQKAQNHQLFMFSQAQASFCLNKGKPPSNSVISRFVTLISFIQDLYLSRVRKQQNHCRSITHKSSPLAGATEHRAPKQPDNISSLQSQGKFCALIRYHPASPIPHVCIVISISALCAFAPKSFGLSLFHTYCIVCLWESHFFLYVCPV